MNIKNVVGIGILRIQKEIKYSQSKMGFYNNKNPTKPSHILISKKPHLKRKNTVAVDTEVNALHARLFMERVKN